MKLNVFVARFLPGSLIQSLAIQESERMDILAFTAERAGENGTKDEGDW
jgi:hypothetical protein